MTLLKESFVFLGNEIVRRAMYDSDPRFRELAQDYREVTECNLGTFYISYLKVFAQVLGEQFAIMQNSDAISGMFNHQNITLLAEIVDHDVTMVGGKVMDEEGKLRDITPREERMFRHFSLPMIDKLYQQLFMGYDSIVVMLNNLSRTGIIKMSNEEMAKIPRIFIKSFQRNANDFTQELKEMAFDDLPSALYQDGDYDFFGGHSHILFMRDLVNEI